MNIGIFGGSFDPVHLGHIKMAHASLEYGLEKLFIVPCLISPHKTVIFGKEAPQQITERWNMLQLAFTDTDRRLELCRFELDGRSPSYTYHTLDYFREKFPQATLFLVMGWDSWCTVQTWARFDQWGRHIHYLVFQRSDTALRFPEPFGTSHLHVTYANEEIPAISSTMIRESILQDQRLDGLVHPAVAEYIQQHGLYRAS